ncbi:Rqc2 family fibronectin-binding protein [Fusobacterium sp. PH5-44]|uniref:Rqc2 family fibronectin-binding protein n=1 Tax=unclassified Fusobacterium TaxID=2648384 RepID=UPI003D23183A
MFYIDGVSLSKIKEELKLDLVGKRINKITKNTELSLSFHFGKRELIFSCNATFPVCYITNIKEEVLELSNGFVDSLRKLLTNGELVEIEQLGLDRILVFKLVKMNELGEEKRYNIYFELMGKYSNFILTDENNKIIDLLKRFSIEENRLRSLFPGVPYEQPIITPKVSPFDVNEELFDRLHSSGELLKKVEGIGKYFIENIHSYQHFERILNAKSSPKLFYKDKKVVFGCILEIEPSNYDEVENYSTFNEVINKYITETNLSNTFKVMENKLLDVIEKKIKKSKNILNILEKERKNNEDFHKYKEHGDILAASIYSVKKGMFSLKTYDFYNDCDIEIPLDIRYTPSENLDKIYKKYNKLKRGLEANQRRTIEVTNELDYFQSLKLFVKNSMSIDNLKLIYEELILEKVIRDKDNLFGKKSNKKSKKVVKVLSYGEITFDNTKILYGRNNLENDNLTFKIADKEDIWLHSKNIPGAHVIIRVDNIAITDEILEKAAEVAAYYTSAKIGEKILIDYTKKKYVKKPKGTKPGFVIYENEKGIYAVKRETL